MTCWRNWGLTLSGTYWCFGIMSWQYKQKEGHIHGSRLASNIGYENQVVFMCRGSHENVLGLPTRIQVFMRMVV